MACWWTTPPEKHAVVAHRSHPFVGFSFLHGGHASWPCICWLSFLTLQSCILALHLPALHATQVEHFSRYGLLPEVEAEVEDLGITGTPGPDIAGPGFGGGAISHIGRATSCSAGLYHT
eukprot:scaffold138711_cov22-Tisochrysis_lutea.AAC.1